ncbi:alpha/beta hydrolase [Microbacterium sp. W1N]|uniref:alpha/beta hydrolase n=1 Tax=Microbacterium festucae TaxID=2977531 RepID=UPI0021BE4E30|nr:alpha/beta hydrolase [Microbacterium festucae]MCT9818802.1 alpha/beta hydrolase [Microbacterium festucae]
MTDDAPVPPAPRKRRGRRIVFWVLGIIGAVIVAAVVGVVVWSQVGVYQAEAEPLAAVRADPGIEITDDSAGVVLSPAEGATGVGLVFIPGAKVDAWAYASTLSGLVDDGMTVVITKPWLNLAFFDVRPLTAFTDLAPDVDDWLVGGHSLGGVRACMMAGDTDGLVLFASYCSNDLSQTDLPVLSLSGSEDGLSTPQKIADSAANLPADATFVQIEGAAHASFGAYGPQDGDGTPTISDADMIARITDEVGLFVAAVPVP